MITGYIQNPHLEGDSFTWPGDETGILLFHGFTATTAEVRPLAKALHSAGFTLAGALLPGHGTQPQDLNRVHWQDWAAAGQEAYRQLAARCERVVLGGESMGAVLALYLAGELSEAVGVMTYAPALRIRRLGLSHLLAPFRPWLAKRRIDASMPWQGYTVYPLRGAAQFARLQRAARARLGRVRQPLLIVQGRQDATIDPRSAELLYHQAGSTVKELHWMEQSGHCVVLDREADQVARISLDFLARVLAREPERTV